MPPIARSSKWAVPPSAAFGRAAARPWTLLIAWSGLLTVAVVLLVPNWFWSWHYVVTGAHVLMGPAPLSLFARHPELQMGPLTFIVAAPFVLLPTAVGHIAAAVGMQAGGLVVAGRLRALALRDDRHAGRRWFVLALLLAIGWTPLAVEYGHLDDVLALVAVAVAAAAAQNGRPFVTAVALGLAIDSKPWAVPFVALLLLLDRRWWLPAGALVAALVALAWGPFLLDPGTLRAATFTISVSSTSTIHLLGIAGSRTPQWCRSAQLVLGLALAVLAVRRGRGEAVLLVVVVVRLLLDPGTKLYYDAGLMAGAVAVDLSAAVPVSALLVLGCVLLPGIGQGDVAVIGVFRAAALIALLLLAALPRRRGPTAGQVAAFRPAHPPEPIT